MQDFRLYLILDKKLCGNRDPLKLAEQAIAGGVDVIQLRDKESATNKIIETAIKLRALTRQKEATFIINDRVDIALAVDADGVHLGKDDLPFDAVRRMLESRKIIGVSAHNLAQAQEAEKKGTDYISIGAIFPTATKSEAPVIDVEMIRQLAASIRTPFVAIGGINLSNIEQVLEAGAERVAVGSAILASKDITQAAKELKSKITKIRKG